MSNKINAIKNKIKTRSREVLEDMYINLYGLKEVHRELLEKLSGENNDLKEENKYLSEKKTHAINLLDAI